MGLFGGPNVDKLRDKRDLKGLAKALTEDDAQVRDDAARALGEIGDPAAVPLVVDRISGQQDEAVIDCGASALGAMGSPAVEALVAGMRGGDQDKRAANTALLGRMEPALAPLLEASSDSDPALRAAAALSLGLVGGDAATTRVTEVFRDDDEIEVRGMAMLAMANNKLPGAYETFAGTLSGDEPVTRALGAMGLGELGDPRGADALRRAAGQDPDDRVRSAAEKALDQLPAG